MTIYDVVPLIVVIALGLLIGVEMFLNYADNNIDDYFD